MTQRVVGDLTPTEVRVLGCLVEKEATTPRSYPLTRNALVAACNQSSSRDPVMDLSDQEVEAALLALRDRRLARPVRNPGDRVTKFRHAVDEVLDLSGPQVAVLSVLALRGPQTVGELRTRTARQHAFDTVDEVAAVLAELAAAEPPLATELARGVGQKEARWTDLLGTRPQVADPSSTADGQGLASGHANAAGPTMAATWLAGARAVVDALADPTVRRAWDQPSVLEDQAVSSLAGHLARGAVWVVGDYLDGDVPDGPADLDGAGQYFAELVEVLGDDDHRAIRDRGAAVAAVGHEHLVRTARSRLAELAVRVPEEDPDRLVAVFGGLTLRLSDYLATRIVEQVVHLDDLVRSVDSLEVDVPDDATEVALAVGMDVLRRRHGAAAPLRVLYRHGFDDLLPVL